MITKAHLIFKTHLDIGFTDTAANVTRLYFTDYIPRAIQTARALREAGDADRFIWTTGSWLIYEYLEQAGAEERRQMEAAILAGDIAWHGLPFTTHTELMDASLFEFGLSLSQSLDRRFGRQTIAAKMSDVPGHTRGIVPLLAAAGIRFLHLGVNDAAAMADVPPVFRWQSPDGSEVVVMYERGYGYGLEIPGMAEALAFGHTSDNLGPQTPDQARAVYAAMRQKYPGADIQASTLDDFARALLPHSGMLPVVKYEIGDTWIHGVGSDPVKVARFRALQRARSEWMESAAAGAFAAELSAFSRHLILVPEHTWGMDEKTHLADWENYPAAKFQSARSQPNFQKFEASWTEQRAYLDRAVAALEGTPLAAQAQEALAATLPSRPETRGWRNINGSDSSAFFDTTHFKVRLDPISGALTLLRHKASGREWADPLHRLGWFRYQTFSQADYDLFFEQYIQQPWPDTILWATQDYSKPGIAATNPEHRWWLPQNVDLFRREDESGSFFLAQLGFPARASSAFGCPRRVFLEWFFPTAAPEAYLTAQWFDKPASRLPEAVWLSFVPLISGEAQWRMDKLGQPVSPREVVPNGNRKLHAVGRGVKVAEQGEAPLKGVMDDASARLEIDTLDAPLVAPGEPSLLNFNNDQPDPKKGMHFNLYNNIWGTNFPMWFEEDAKFRFKLILPGG